MDSCLRRNDGTISLVILAKKALDLIGGLGSIFRSAVFTAGDGFLPPDLVEGRLRRNDGTIFHHHPGESSLGLGLRIFAFETPT